MVKQDPSAGRNWYVIHTYSGYEDSVKKSLEQRAETFSMRDYIFNVVVPKEKQIVFRKNEPVEEEKKLFPGYVLIDMIVTDDSWYMVRNTPNVTGFVGSGNIPVPVTPEEFGIVERRMGEETAKFKSDFQVGDLVVIIDGPFKNYEGTVDAVDVGKGKLTILVLIFDRDTPVELDFTQVRKKYDGNRRLAISNWLFAKCFYLFFPRNRQVPDLQIVSRIERQKHLFPDKAHAVDAPQYVIYGHLGFIGDEVFGNLAALVEHLDLVIFYRLQYSAGA